MKHARKDYDRIQDPLNLIPENEPVFLLRGQDALAIPTMTRYCELLNQYEPDKKTALIESVQEHIRRVRDYQRSETGRVKLPDMKSEKELQVIDQLLTAMEDDAPRLQAKVAAQQKEVDALTKELHEANDEREQLLEARAILQNELQHAKAEIEKLKRIVDSVSQTGHGQE